MPSASDTIVAIATPPGRGGIGVVRISGSQARAIAKTLCGIEPEPRRVQLTAFTGVDGSAIDRGLALFCRARRCRRAQPCGRWKANSRAAPTRWRS